ncbi:LexA family transcriptional regulator [Halomonas salipaludis]|uniref:Peptidase S24/S26A/S26B/S26C domain-containing protein n=1 Tax=Halomonas salipaludis TaxID=2032625 RepID=A0A2A2ETJ3_9GAMM|nr:hypothetical protein [Halomonas salipaludis]PAU76751.1 hypothetical protein CK498_12270 [Halomonas salipaludis]
MKVNYLGPAGLVANPALEGLFIGELTPSCYLVEVAEEAGVSGPLIEGDVLVVDEARVAQHADLVVVEIEQEYRLFRSHRIGGGYRLLPACGGSGMPARNKQCRGVVVQCQRLSA